MNLLFRLTPRLSLATPAANALATEGISEEIICSRSKDVGKIPFSVLNDRYTPVSVCNASQ